MMKHSSTFALIAFTTFGAISLVHCSSPSTGSRAPGGDAEDDARGNVGLELTLAPGVTVNTASYAITGPNGYSLSGTIDVSQSSTISGQINRIPAGTGYSITLTAISIFGELNCAGQSNFSVAAGQTTNVNVRLYCRPIPGDGGAVVINADANVCPFITSMAAWPTTTAVGGSITLTSSAQDLSGQALTYTWSSTPASFASNFQNPTFVCPGAGVYQLKLAVSDGDVACNDSSTIDVVCTPAPAGSDSACPGTGLTPKTAGCLACEAIQCPHDATLQPACADYPTPVQRQACQTVLDCVRRTNCIALGNVSCYCGPGVSTLACKEASATTDATITGACKNEIAAGFPAGTAPISIVNGANDVSNPAGGALALAQCDYAYCGSPALGGNAECVPYCH